MLPVGQQCSHCAHCLGYRGVLRDLPQSLLETPPPGQVTHTRVAGILVEEREAAPPAWVVMLGPYVSGGGHRMLVREYLDRTERDQRKPGVLRWAGEGALSWSGHCLSANRLNETSGMVARRHELAMPIAYEAMDLAEAAATVAHVISPWCQRGRTAPHAHPFDPDAAHLNERLNWLKAQFTGDVRHDLGNAQMRLYNHFFTPEGEASATFTQEVRRICGATLGFLEVVRQDDKVAWAALPAALAERVLLSMQLASVTGQLRMEEIDELIGVMGRLGAFRAALEFRLDAAQLSLR